MRSSLRRALLLAAAMQAVVGVAYALLGDRMSFHDAWPAMLLFLAVEFPGSIVTDLVAPTSWPDWAVFGLIVTVSFTAWAALLSAIQDRRGGQSSRTGS